MIAELLDAEITVLGPAGERTVSAADMFKGFLETDLRPDEMILEVRLRGFDHTSIKEVCRRQGDFAVAAAAVALSISDGRCTEARVVLGGVGGSVVRVTSAEDALVGAAPSESLFAAAAAAAAAVINPPTDLHGPPEYRRHLASVLVRRALIDAAGPHTGSQ
jgi:carbon-monoxide dehydrogenase medium subunit